MHPSRLAVVAWYHHYISVHNPVQQEGVTKEKSALSYSGASAE